jgi:hypothetical protein
MSDEVYIITEDNPIVGDGYQKDNKVRLISGVDGSSTPGYHFSKGYVTVCSIDAKIAEFVGLRQNTLEPDKGDE